MSLSFDTPLEPGDPDPLGHSAVADAIVSAIRSLDGDATGVLALTAPWGAGKTSTLNRIRAEFERDASGVREFVVVDLNAWLLAEGGDLTQRFLEELAAGLAAGGALDRVRGATAAILSYARRVTGISALLGAGMVGEITGALEQAVRGAPPSMRELRLQIADELSNSGTRILVLVDDIDRLAPQDVRSLLRVVRLVADIPGVVYVAALDWESTVRALELSGGQGYARGYLEKIVQVAWALPAPSEDAIAQLLLVALQQKVPSIGVRLADEDRNSRFWSAILKATATPRDVERLSNYVATLPPDLSEQLDWRDLVLAETLRAKLPDLWARLREREVQYALGVRALDFESFILDETERLADRKQAGHALVESIDAEHRYLAGALLEGLFPGAPTIGPRRGLGAIHDDMADARSAGLLRDQLNLEFYVRQVLHEGILPPAQRRIISDSIHDAAALERTIAAVPGSQLEDAVQVLEGPLARLSSDERWSRVVALIDTLGSSSEAVSRRLTALVTDALEATSPDLRVGRVMEIVHAPGERGRRAEPVLRALVWRSDERRLPSLVGEEQRGAVRDVVRRWLDGLALGVLPQVRCFDVWMGIIGNEEAREFAQRNAQNGPWVRSFIEGLWREPGKQSPYGWRLGGAGSMEYGPLPLATLRMWFGPTLGPAIDHAAEAGLAEGLVVEATRALAGDSDEASR